MREESRTNEPLPRSSIKLTLVVGLAWLAVTVLGLRAMWVQANVPGNHGEVPTHWPVRSAIHLTKSSPTLVFMAHPKCACTRASLEALSWVLARTENRLQVHVLFVVPDGLGDDWARTDLLETAERIPGVVVSIDHGGVEARKFGAKTSGFALVYDREGRLVFEGGLTPDRGHAGDSPGRNAIPSLLDHSPERAIETPVFGCPLFDENSDCSKEPPICQHES